MTSEQTPARSFRALALVLSGVLVVAALGLGVAGVVRGPALSGVRVQPERAAAVAGERVVFRTRQPILPVEAAQVSVTPATPFTVESRELGVAITFPNPLAYATGYTVEIRGVRGRHTGVSLDWRTSFATPAASLYTLLAQRADSADTKDVVVRVAPGVDPVPLLSAPRIDSFAVVDATAFAISRADLDADVLLAASGKGEPTRMVTPDDSSLALLRGSAELGLIGYAAAGSAGGDNPPSVTLYLQDARDLDELPRPVTADGGAPLNVIDWAFMPGAPAVVVQDEKQRLHVISVDGQSPPMPLGTHNQILGVLPGRPALMVLNGPDAVVLDLGAGTTTKLPELDLADEKESVLVQRSAISVEEEIVQFDVIDRGGSATTLRSVILHRKGTKLTPLLEVDEEQGRVLRIGTSGNAQQAWVEVLDPDAPIDEVTSGASTQISVHLIDLATSQEVGTVPGTQPVWVPTP